MKPNTRHLAIAALLISSFAPAMALGAGLVDLPVASTTPVNITARFVPLPPSSPHRPMILLMAEPLANAETAQELAQRLARAPHSSSLEHGFGSAPAAP